MPDAAFTLLAPTPRRLPRGAVAAAALTLAWALGWTMLGASSAQAREGVEVGQESRFAKLVSADTVENAANQKYAELMKQARAQNALFPDNHPQVVRVRDIARRIIPYTFDWNPRARQWNWQVNLINAKEINAFCMPGGKIAFYYGILQQLQQVAELKPLPLNHLADGERRRNFAGQIPLAVGCLQLTGQGNGHHRCGSFMLVCRQILF